jgi:endonuclease/exonuclease/phosphatase family metal-dependent hydrolase
MFSVTAGFAATHSVFAFAEPSNSQQPTIFSVATYNIQGMSDASGASFPPDYSATQSNWVSHKMYEVKAANIAKALAIAGTPDIVALQELKYIDPSGTPFKIMWPHLEKLGYKYWAYGPQTPKHPKGHTASDTQGIISKFPIVSVEGLRFVDTNYWGASRDPLAVTIHVMGNPLRVYVVHTKAKASEKTPEDAATGNAVRKAMLSLVREDIQKQRAQNPDIDIIVMGDMNAGYHEDSIVEGLGVTGNESAMLDNGNAEEKLYNLWHEMAPQDRCTTTYKGMRECIDHINVSASLYDNHGIQYIDNSFSIAGLLEWWKSPLVNANGTGKRWQTKVTELPVPAGEKPQRFTTHLGFGFSDHIPLVAKFRVMGASGDTSRMTLSTPPSKETLHNTLFFHIPYCTNANGEFAASETVHTLSPTKDLSSPQLVGNCFSLENGSIPIRIVDTYDTRTDYGFVFASANPNLKTLSINVQYDDQNPHGRKIDRNKILKDFFDAIAAATAAGQKVSLVGIKGRLDVNFGKVTIFAEGPISIKVE